MARAVITILLLSFVRFSEGEDKLYFAKSINGPHITRHSFFRLQFKLSYRLKLFCEAEGSPRPSITWYKEGREISPDARTTIFEERHGLTTVSRLQIQLTRMSDAGEYQCVAQNREGAHVKQFRSIYTLR